MSLVLQFEASDPPLNTLTPQLVRALIQAAQDGCNVINLSYGGGVGWLRVTPTQILIDYLVSQGIHIVAATGNDGPEGEQRPSLSRSRS